MHQQLFELSTTKYYGMIRGIVMNNVDPNKKGACQVMFYPMFNGIPTVNLPWAIPAMPLFDGAGAGTGSFCVPKVGTKVWGWFEEGDIYQPIFFAEATDYVVGQPSVLQTAGYPANYPNVKAWQTSSGINIVIDDIAKVVTITMPSSASISLDNNGVVNLISNNRVNVTAPEMTTKNLSVSSGASGTFGTVDGSLVSVVNGIVTDID